MEKLLKLKQAREAALARANALYSKSVAGVFAEAAEQTAWDAEMSEVERLDTEIKTAQDAQDAAAASAARNAERMAAVTAVQPPRTRANAPASTAIVSRQVDRSQADPTRGFRDLGDFAMQVFGANPNVGGRMTEQLAPLAAATGGSQAVGSDGGFLVPPQFSTAIWDGLNNPTESLLGMCDQYPVDGDSLTMNANAETSRASGSRYGGVQAYWLAEAAQATQTKPKFRRMKLEPHGMAAMVYMTDKLLRNAPAMSAYLSRAAADEINFVVGDSLINGTGAGKPLGIMNSGALVTVAKEASQANGSVLQANISKMWARLHPRCRKNAVWFYNCEVEPQFDGLNLPIKNIAGTENVGGISNVVWNAEKNTLKGRPVMPIEYCQALGTPGDLILADMSMYAAGTQGGVESAVSMHLRFDYAEQAFRFMFYVDGQPWLASALTPYKGASTLTSFVVLAQR